MEYVLFKSVKREKKTPSHIPTNIVPKWQSWRYFYHLHIVTIRLRSHLHIFFLLISTLLSLFFLYYRYSLFQNVQYYPNNIFTNPNNTIFMLIRKSLCFIYFHLLILNFAILTILHSIQTYPKKEYFGKAVLVQIQLY